MECACMIYFEDPFWVGIFERTSEKGYAVVRYVFGAEPTEAELLRFALHRYAFLRFSEPGPVRERKSAPLNFKRRQREIRQQEDLRGHLTRAQAAVQAERERQKVARKQTSRAERDTAQGQQFELRQAKRKEKHRGH